MDERLLACLPDALLGAEMRIERVNQGMSGAGVYRVFANGRSYVLKVARDDEAPEDWRRMTQVLTAAGKAGVGPEVVHANETTKSVVMTFIEGDSFLPTYFNPATAPKAFEDLAGTLRTIHAIPLQPGWTPKDAPVAMGYVLKGLQGNGGVPKFAEEVFERIKSSRLPPPDRPLTLCHNDLNPSNLIFANGRLMLLDWDQARPNEPFYDVAAVSLFLRMSDEQCLALLSAYERKPVASLPERFRYHRRVVAGFCGTIFLHLARLGGAPGNIDQTAQDTDSLSEAYGKLRNKLLDLSKPEDRWRFGLSFLKESLAI
ncbi:MAG TPA: phosphotransferase [Opitutaceae bacterium]|jgi:aminoglycoside phosphotransferase (APT) family kinase protein